MTDELSGRKTRSRASDPILIETDRLSTTLRGVHPAGFAACAAASIVGFYIHALWLPFICIPGAVGFFASYILTRRGAVEWASWAVVITATSLVTTSGLIGTGVRDPGVLAYPVVLIFAGMMLDGPRFFSALAFTAASFGLVVANQFGRWIPVMKPPMPGWVDVFIALIILSATVYAVRLLAENARESLMTASLEIDRRRAVERELHLLSTQDFLTGAYNRRFFDAQARLWAQTGNGVASVIVADVDDLKALNDEQGHAAGDELLVRAADLIRSVIRAEDVLARMGGDEFSILLPGASAEAAAEAVARIKSALAENASRDDGPRVSLSMGYASIVDGSLDDALKLADARMYEAKLEHRAARGGSAPFWASPAL